MERQFECVDEQTNISSLSIELYCKKMAANYKSTAHQLDIILEDSKGAVSPTLGGTILINTIDDKRLAVAIVQEVKHYFGEPTNKPKNTADEVLIINMANGWLESVKRSTAKTTWQEYVDFVVERAKREYNLDSDRAKRGDTATTFKEIINAVEQWAETMRKRPKTKKAKEPEPRKAINKHGHFCSTITEDQARRLFQLLTEKHYINGEVSDWMIICGIREGTLEKRINWIPDLNELAYFVIGLFGPANHFKWAITVNVFSWKGDDIKQNSIRNSYSKCSIAKGKRDALDEILRKVLKNNSVVNELRNI